MKMTRAEKLHNIFKDVDEGKKAIVSKLIDEAVFLEGQLAELKKFKFLKSKTVKKTDGEEVLLQKVTAAGKQYREYLQTYTNIIRALERTYANEEAETESPLRAFLKGLETR